MRRTVGLLVLIPAFALATGCSAGDDSEPPALVATTTILGDVTTDIVECADPDASVEVLMPIGADPHDFAASSSQVADMVHADLVVANGLELEASLADALAAAVEDGGTVLEVAPLVDPIPFGEDAEHDHDDEDEHAEDEESESAEDEHAHEDEESTEDEHDHGSLDPHFWNDVSRMATAAELIGSETAEITGDEAFADCGVEVSEALMATDAEVRETLDVVLPEDRVLVTDHDAFGYFADAYDFEIAGVVIPGGSTLAEPSSAELAELVETIETENVPAIFSNSADPSTLVDAVAAETGHEVEVVELYVGSLGPEGSGAETYPGMMLTNAEAIAGALG